MTVARAGLAVDVLVRLRSNSRFYQTPGPSRAEAEPAVPEATGGPRR